MTPPVYLYAAAPPPMYMYSPPPPRVVAPPMWSPMRSAVVYRNGMAYQMYIP